MDTLPIAPATSPPFSSFRVTAIVPPGKNATPEEIAAYDKRMGVPDAYEFTVPEGYQPTDADKAFQTKAAEVFKQAKVTGEGAKVLNTFWNEMQAAAQAQAQKQTLESYEAHDKALHAEWGSDYTANEQIANDAFKNYAALAGIDDIEGFVSQKMANGVELRAVPELMRVFAEIGRKTVESSGIENYGSQDERRSLQEQHLVAGGKAIEAGERGNKAEQRKWHAESMRLSERMYGKAPAQLTAMTG